VGVLSPPTLALSPPSQKNSCEKILPTKPYQKEIKYPIMGIPQVVWAIFVSNT